jgi:acetyl esterase/lipase
VKNKALLACIRKLRGWIHSSPQKEKLTLRSSAVAVLLLLALGAAVFQNAQKSLLEDLKEQFAFSFAENEKIMQTLCERFELSCEHKNKKIRMPAEKLAEYTESIVYKDIAYGKKSRQRLDILVPTSIQKGEKLPVVVFFHGGAWMRGSREDLLYSHFARSFTQNSFIFVNVDYRVYPEVRFPGFFNDPKHAIEWVHEHISNYGGNPHHLILMGHSAGAHLVALLTVQDDLLPPVIFSDIKKVVLLSGPYHLPAYRGYLQTEFRGIVEKVFLHLFGGEENLPEISPVNRIEKTHIQYLIAVGEKDRVTPPAQSQLLYQKLREKGNKAELIVLPNTGHAGTVFHLNSEFDQYGFSRKVLDFLQNPAQNRPNP